MRICTLRMPRDKKHHLQANKALVRQVGDLRLIQFPDGGAQPLKQWIKQHQCRMRDGFGSHMNGRHKMG